MCVFEAEALRRSQGRAAWLLCFSEDLGKGRRGVGWKAHVCDGGGGGWSARDAIEWKSKRNVSTFSAFKDGVFDAGLLKSPGGLVPLKGLRGFSFLFFTKRADLFGVFLQCSLRDKKGKTLLWGGLLSSLYIFLQVVRFREKGNWELVIGLNAVTLLIRRRNCVFLLGFLFHFYTRIRLEMQFVCFLFLSYVFFYSHRVIVAGEPRAVLP